MQWAPSTPSPSASAAFQRAASSASPSERSGRLAGPGSRLFFIGENDSPASLDARRCHTHLVPVMATALRDFLGRHPRLFVLTGAGCSTDSGIPDYRDADGGWKRSPPVMFQAFMSDLHTRRRYWARSLVGWRHFRRAQPNDTHRALARLEERGRIELLVTQNVDRLHQAAGSASVVDLHG